MINIITLSNNNQQICTQRKEDGYINATLLCKNTKKLFADYQRLETTKSFLSELSTDMGIPISVDNQTETQFCGTELIQIKKGGNPQEQGTWVHPQVAINLA